MSQTFYLLNAMFVRKGHFSHKGCIKVQANSQSACTRDLHSRADKQALLFI